LARFIPEEAARHAMNVRASWIAFAGTSALRYGSNTVPKIRPIKPQEESMRVDRLLCNAAALLAMACFSLPAAAQVAKAVLKDASGKVVGDVNLVQTSNGVLIRLTVKGMPAGEHAFHVHAVGKCEPPFTTAGDHLNPGSKKHGLEAADGAHAGDMPNLHIPSSGDLNVEVVNTMITLAKGQPNSVFDADGSAVLIHAKADDYKSDPAGNAGDRVACGVITQ
jgi:Cu-Zn family superoxide dismutase